jgi:hypothetical protein
MRVLISLLLMIQTQGSSAYWRKRKKLLYLLHDGKTFFIFVGFAAKSY